MAQLIFATGNAGKMREIREILSDLPLEVKSMKEAGIDVDVVEDGTTFEENALIKARAIHAVSGGIVLADDSGLVVDYMDGMPGIYSARFMGEDTSYDIKNQAIIDALEKAEGEARSARFVCDCSGTAGWKSFGNERNYRRKNRLRRTWGKWFWI